MKTAFKSCSAAAIGLLSVLLVSGCASTPRGLKHTATEAAVVVDAQQSPTDQEFAAAAASVEFASTADMQRTPIGAASVTVLDPYTNGLGEVCKRIEVRNAQTVVKGAVCLGADQVWRFVRHL